MKYLFLPLLILVGLSINAQWDRQYPFNHVGIINDIVINGDDGAAVGDDATIFLTSDGGENWSIRDNPLNGWNFATVERSGDVIYACGKGIYKSIDGGTTFEVLADAPQEIFDSHLTASGVLIVTNNKGVFKSIDGGSTFINLNTPADSLGVASFIYDENHIWWTIAGLNTVLYITRDGGVTWESNTELTRPKNIAFFNKDIGIASALPYIYYTEDGGQTWEERARLSRNINRMAFGSSPDSIYITSGKNIYSSYDRCATFNEFKNIITSAEVSGLFKNKNGKLLVGASFSTIAESSDEASSWSDISGKVKPHIGAMVSTNGQDVYAAGAGVMLHTKDGGENWDFYDTVGVFNQGMAIIEDEAVLLSGIRSIVRKDLKTKEESTIYGPVLGIFESIHITPSGRWITYSSKDYYMLSDDQGVSWDSFYIEPFSNGIDMVENGDLFMRIRGKLLISRDEGTSWEEIYTAKVPRDLRRISIIDSTIYMMESTSNLRKSSDYGQTWDSIATPMGFSMIVAAIHFINQDTGYLYDSTGDKLWYTYDGGLTWPFSYFPKVGLNGIYDFSNDDVQSVWLYGLGAFIEKQSDCKNAPLLSDIQGERFPCILDTITYAVNGSSIDNYVWFVPDEWVIVGPDDGPEITIYAEDPGVGYLTVYGENACGSTNALELQIAGTAIPDVELLQFGAVLRTEEGGDIYQWFKDGVLIPGADKDFYAPTESGTYTVLVTFSTTCSRLSNSIDIEITSVTDINSAAISIQPNPVSGDYFWINHSNSVADVEILIRNTIGQVVHKETIQTSTSSTFIKVPPSIRSGLYFVSINGFSSAIKIIIER